MNATARGSRAVEAWADLTRVRAVRAEWNALAARGGSPFITVEWFESWWGALGDGEPLWLLLHASDGSLRAGACCRIAPTGELTAATDPAHGYDWDVVATDDDARRDVWDAITQRAPRRVEMAPIVDAPLAAGAATDGLLRAGYRVVRNVAEVSPYVPLPGTWEALLGSVSKKLRWQWRSNRRLLADSGGVMLRTISDERDVARELDRFLALEASGWKGRAGTAILCDASTERLYRTFAEKAARQGWLRLSFLECEEIPIAGSLGCVFGGSRFRIKSAFDERHADRSPGLVAVGEELRESIQAGLAEYNFMGAADPHKMRWGAQTRARVRLRGYRGAAVLPTYVYRAGVRPLLGRLGRRARRIRTSG